MAHAISNEQAEPYPLHPDMLMQKIRGPEIRVALQTLMDANGLDQDALWDRLTKKPNKKRLKEMLHPEGKEMLTQYLMTDIANVVGVPKLYPDAYGHKEVKQAVLDMAAQCTVLPAAPVHATPDGMPTNERLAAFASALQDSYNESRYALVQTNQKSPAYTPSLQDALTGIRAAYGLARLDVQKISTQLYQAYGRKDLYVKNFSNKIGEQGREAGWEMLRKTLNEMPKTPEPFTSVDELQRFGFAAFNYLRQRNVDGQERNQDALERIRHMPDSGHGIGG